MIRFLMTLIGLVVWSHAIAYPLLLWDPSDGAEGYKVYCDPTPIVDTPTPIPTVDTSYDMTGAVTPGVQYECWVTAYAAGVPDSADSNHIRFTPPTTVQTIVVPGQPSSVTISWE